MKRAATLIGAACVAANAAAQPALSIRFDNGQSEITAEPGSPVRVHVWAMGLPPLGTQIPWTTPPGTGQAGAYEGFASVLFNLMATSGAWSNLSVAPGLGTFPEPPIGHPAGSNVIGIQPGIGFGPPITQPEFPMWHGTLTIGSADVSLSTLILAVGHPPQTGLEVFLSGVVPPLNVSHFLSGLNGAAVIHVPAPAGLSVLGLACLSARRRR